MRVLITKDGATKIPREVADMSEARQIASTGFHVELLGEDGVVSQLPEEAPPADDAHVEVGSTRFSDSQIQTEATLQAAQSAPAPKSTAAAKKRRR